MVADQMLCLLLLLVVQGKGDTTRDPSKHATRNQVDAGECETECAEDIQATDQEQDDIELPNKDELNESMDIKKSEKKGRRKRKYTSTSAASAQSITQWLESHEAKQQKQEDERIEKAEKMHIEKMGILRDLVNILKQY